MTCLTLADFHFTGLTSGRKPKLSGFLESLITLFFSYRCGSVIVDVTLSFNTTVTEKRILNILKDAAKDGKLGDFNIDVSSIIHRLCRALSLRRIHNTRNLMAIL